MLNACVDPDEWAKEVERNLPKIKKMELDVDEDPLVEILKKVD